MAGFLYFRASSQPVTKEIAKACGLGYSVTSPTVVPVSDSPCGGPGIVFAQDEEGLRVGYDPDKQAEWKEFAVEGQPRLFLSYWKDSPPLPQDLAKSVMLSGPEITLADGNGWQIPIVRNFDGSDYDIALPRYVDCDTNGNIIEGEVLEAHRELLEITAPVMSAEMGEGEVTNEQIIKAVVALISANYKVTLKEIACLRLLCGNENIATASLVANEFAILAGWLESDAKKNDPQDSDGSNTTDGDAA